jgi:hypothetical protein
MLATFRLIARPLSFVALLTLLIPSWAECRPLAGAEVESGMSCCAQDNLQQGKLDSGCCTVGRAPEPQQVPATTACRLGTSRSTALPPPVRHPTLILFSRR